MTTPALATLTNHQVRLAARPARPTQAERLAAHQRAGDGAVRRRHRAEDAAALGVTDLPLVIQDKQFDAQGKLVYRPNAHESMMGWLGDVVLANLTPNAAHTVTQRTYRLRLRCRSGRRRASFRGRPGKPQTRETCNE